MTPILRMRSRSSSTTIWRASSATPGVRPGQRRDPPPVYELIFQAGAAEGIGFFFSSGDNGYESPAEDPVRRTRSRSTTRRRSPWVTSVGGTSLAIGANANYQFETSWGTLLDPLSAAAPRGSTPLPGNYPKYYDGSSGGGTSTVYTPALLPERGRPGLAVARSSGRRNELGGDARGARRLGSRRPEHGHARRRDDPSTRREDVRVLAQPDRRHIGGVPDVRRYRSRCPAGRRLHDRVRQPGDIPQVRDAGVPRRDRPSRSAPDTWRRSATTTRTRMPRKARSSRTCARSASTARAPRRFTPPRVTTTPPVSDRPTGTSSRSPSRWAQ